MIFIDWKRKHISFNVHWLHLFMFYPLIWFIFKGLWINLCDLKCSKRISSLISSPSNVNPHHFLFFWRTNSKIRFTFWEMANKLPSIFLNSNFKDAIDRLSMHPASKDKKWSRIKDIMCNTKLLMLSCYKRAIICVCLKACFLSVYRIVYF